MSAITTASPSESFASESSTSPRHSSATASPPAVPTRGVHRSRPSFAISYSQPSSAFTASNAGIPGAADPNPSSGVYRGPFTRPQQPTRAMPSSVTATTSEAVGNSVQQPKQFVAPAHPQSHHLHSLPPREKTTRTLILDHTAWRQGRTRFAQGRCELGMKVKFKNPDSSAERSEGSGKRPGFFVGTSSSTGYKRPSDFGEPPEIDVASSDDDGESDAFGDYEAERVQFLTYGRRFRQKRREARRQENRMEVDSEDESSSMSESESEDDQSHSFRPTENAVHARSLSARASGMDKVLQSMLSQPPSSPPRSPSPPPYAMQGSAPVVSTSIRPRSSSNILPNGLRLRLSLVALANDLFERQPSTGLSESPEQKQTSSVPEAPLPPPSLSLNTPPPGLATLTQVSSQPFYTPPTLPSFHTLSLPSSSSSGNPPPNFGSSLPKSPHPRPFVAATSVPEQRRPPPVFTWPSSSSSSASPATPSSAVSSPWGGPSHSRSADSPTSSSFPKPGGSTRANVPQSWTQVVGHNKPNERWLLTLTKRAAGRSRDLFGIGCYTSPSTVKTMSTFQRTVPTFSYGGSASVTVPAPTPEYPIQKLKTLCPRHLHELCRICEPVCAGASTARGSSAQAPSTRIGAGLLRKEQRGGEGSGCVLADLLPRFLRLSALVAMELGREARGEEPEAVEDPDLQTNETAATSNNNNNINIYASASTSSPPKSANSFSTQAQPTRAWFALLCGLVTRAVLEGYVARGWKGAEYAEVLMGVGLGIKGVGTRRSSAGFGAGKPSPDSNPLQQLPEVPEVKNEYEPDEMPNLVDACKSLFSGLVQDVKYPDAKDRATRTPEQEYVSEMEERMSEFLTISHGTPDLATHLTQLSEKYPAEPVERAALQFCEAVSKWRGKPELEMYKRSNKCKSSKSTSSTPAPLSLNSLLASTPVPHRPPIQKYFRICRVNRKPSSPQLRSLKRQRSVDEDSRDTKKEKVGDQTAMDVDSRVQQRAHKLAPIDAIPDSEWVGPYGV